LEHDNSTDSERQSTKERGEEAGEVNGVRLPSEYQDN
jgi:hypothetical protein